MGRKMRREIGDDNYMGINLNLDSKRKLDEMLDATGHTISFFIELCIDVMYDSKPWPEFIPADDLDQFTELIRRKKEPLRLWCFKNDTTLAMVYYIFRRQKNGRIAGGGLAATEARRVRMLIEKELGYELKPGPLPDKWAEARAEEAEREKQRG